MKTRLSLALAVVLVVSVFGPGALAGNDQSHDDQFYASSERFGYTGTVSVYDSWAEAMSGRNPRCTAVAWPQRDGAIFAVRNAPEYWVDSNMILTNWYSTDDPPPPYGTGYWGKGNPNNTNEGFFQLYDWNADAWQNQRAYWSSDLDTFTVTAKGRNATYGSDYPLDYARLWNACAPAGGGESTKGTFLQYEYEFVASGLNGEAGPDGFATNTTDASDYSGFFRGVFLNESEYYPASNGYYVFEITFNNTSWAATTAGVLVFPDEFGAWRTNNS